MDNHTAELRIRDYQILAALKGAKVTTAHWVRVYVQRQTRDPIHSRTVYKSLNRLKKRGLVEELPLEEAECEITLPQHAGLQPLHAYRPTEEGLQLLFKDLSDIKALSSGR